MSDQELRKLVRRVTNELVKRHPSVNVQKAESTSGPSTLCDDLFALADATQQALIDNNCLP